MDFTTTFSNGKYIICDSKGIQVVEISKNENSLYKIVHETEVNIVKDMLIIDKIHWCLSYITSAATRKLIQNGIITGLKLNGNKEVDIFCKSCIYIKVTQLSITKKRSKESTKEFGKKTHLDIWELAKNGDIMLLLLITSHIRHILSS